MTENELSRAVIGCAMEVHTKLGSGLLEKTYQQCLIHDLRKEGFKIESEKSISIRYGDLEIKDAYRVDILVNDTLVVELKSVEEFSENHYAQVLTYLKLGGYKLGLLLNFKEKSLKNGIRRIVNGLNPMLIFYFGETNSTFGLLLPPLAPFAGTYVYFASGNTLSIIESMLKSNRSLLPDSTPVLAPFARTLLLFASKI
ncbi:MAG: GxxExxY protein [Bacteroidota bacterium]